MNRITLIFLILIVQIFSCQKEDKIVNNIKPCYLKEVRIDSLGTRLLYEFEYNQDNKLSKKKEYISDPQSLYRIHIYLYNNVNKIESINSYNKDSILIKQTLFEYDDNGLMKKESYFNKENSVEIEYDGYTSFEYYDNKYIKKVSVYNKYNSLRHYYLFEAYDKNGNSKVKKIYISNQTNPSSIVNYEYSEVINPFFIYEHPWYSNHNLESSLTGWGTSDYTVDFEINEFGYPTISRETNISSGLTQYLHYSYY